MSYGCPTGVHRRDLAHALHDVPLARTPNPPSKAPRATTSSTAAGRRGTGRNSFEFFSIEARHSGTPCYHPV